MVAVQWKSTIPTVYSIAQKLHTWSNFLEPEPLKHSHVSQKREDVTLAV